MCKLYATDADGESVRTCAGFPLQHKQRSVSLWSRASYYEITRMCHNKLGYDKKNVVYRDEAELIAGKLTNGLKDEGNYKLCMYHFPSAQTTHSGRCRIIIDCTEIWIQRPEDDEIAKQHYSTYKKRHTMKWLIGITPCGSISFVSAGYLGGTTDDEICRASGFYELVESGDAVMADRGFTEFTALRERGAELIIPALSFAKGPTYGVERAAMTSCENKVTYQVANVRIHVERMMRMIKGGWHCFDAPLTIQMIPLFGH
mmetsp:Transcript_42804/g.105502  ORF Transcript_42804/g.105502 Transcript_42804/m.105502 type:complete len:259 (+) Transcript_42804:325-1101(+)